MGLTALPDWIASTLLLGLRIGPVIALAPPFTLVRMPLFFRVLLGLGLSAGMLGAAPQSILQHPSLATLIPAAGCELAFGLMFVLALQILFGALYTAGRTIDMQAGLGLALLIDPTTRTQTPLVGMLFAYAAGAVFFALDGHLALLRLIGASLDLVPLGQWALPTSLARLGLFMGTIFSMALGFGGLVIAALFLADLCIAFMARTVPQMNVLIFGFQVKTILLLATLPFLFGMGGALLIRLVTATLEAIPALL